MLALYLKEKFKKLELRVIVLSFFQIVGSTSVCYASERSEVNPSTRQMILKTRNVSISYPSKLLCFVHSFTYNNIGMAERILMNYVFADEYPSKNCGFGVVCGGIMSI